ncbi:4Fe-4S binding protein [Marispirochaeta aestuarii]|uniref:4Fe-4S binding protein n=1 Tax=Marispirochaeta aestuarii TaxID=1963862 RepID=UPI0029C91022|nr:4Fe-4S binding protein [Marispirochaeta aestuarii]
MTSGRSLNRYLLFITLAYFTLGFVHIGFALSGLLCMTIPFVLVFRDRKKSWCQGYCPRAQFFDLFRKTGDTAKTPGFLLERKTRDLVLSYFCMNLFFIAASTMMVAAGNMAPIDRVRILIIFEIPFAMPQLLSQPVLPPALLHFSYRIYSMMTTSFLAGTLLALLYRPRTWCRVCPVNTMSDRVLKNVVQVSRKA